MRIASFNIQNVYARNSDLVKDYKAKQWDYWMEEFEELHNHCNHSSKEIDRLRELAVLLGFHSPDGVNHFSIDRIQGSLYISNHLESSHIPASELSNWEGWSKLSSQPINSAAIKNKARVITDVNADMLILQEVESRQNLVHFNSYYLEKDEQFDKIHYCEGNDGKGLGMALLLKKGYELVSTKSYANVPDIDQKPLFEIGLVQYKVQVPEGPELIIININLNENTADSKKNRQIKFLTELHNTYTSQNCQNIVLAGTLNMPSYSKELIPLFKQTGLKDITKHPSFQVAADKGKDASYFRMGAYQKGVNIKQNNYLLLSPSLFDDLKICGLNRKGKWPTKKPKWVVYDSLKLESHTSSSNPLLLMMLK